jgi:hypothetical protein
MTIAMTDDQLLESAEKAVLAALPYSREFMEQLISTDLPIMVANGSIHGPALDNAAVFQEYPEDWTGLAISIFQGKPAYWFVYRCERFNERALSCLGPQPSTSAAIEAAVQHVRADLKHWGSASKAA